MGDVMLFGVLRMPYDMAMADEYTRYQYHQRGLQAANAIEALQAQLAEAREQRDRAIALAEKAQDRLIEAMDRVDEARDKALDDAAMVADGAPYKRGGIVCGCSEGLAGWMPPTSAP